MSRSIGSVALVGAGPGAADLVTLRGLDRLERADVVVFDRLIPLALLERAPAWAERIDVGKSPGRRRFDQRAIEGLCIARAQAGRRVVRLKGGDPFVFGRGFEELSACRAAGVPCEVVPGLSSAVAVPALAGIPVTARGTARSFAVATPASGSERAAAPLDWGALAGVDTVCLLMARATLAEDLRALIAAGRPPATPAAIVERGGTERQRTVVGTLADLARRADAAGVSNPAVVVVGEVARHGSPQGAELDAADPGACAIASQTRGFAR